jgi:hypothetical protein
MADFEGENANGHWTLSFERTRAAGTYTVSLNRFEIRLYVGEGLPQRANGESLSHRCCWPQDHFGRKSPGDPATRRPGDPATR